MIQIQVKDNCYLCLHLDPDCAYCNGTGEVTTWITLDDLTAMISDNQERIRIHNEPPSTDQTFKMTDAEDLEIKPNPNI